MRLFLFWMLLASGLGFAKVLILAQILPRADFGQYVSVVGIAMMSGIFLSFGLIEGTTKKYPRMWVAGKADRILNDASLIANKLVLRFAISIAAIAVPVFIVHNQYSPVDVGVGGIVGLCTGLLSLVASLLRSTDSPGVLQVFSVVRSLMAFAIVCALAAIAGWRGAIAGEALAGVASLIFGRASIRRAFATRPDNEPARELPLTDGTDSMGGMKLYMATLCSSSTSLTDRAFLSAVSGPAVAGAYGVVALIFQIGQLLVNIVSQRIGPLIIKARFPGSPRRRTTASLRMLGAALGVVCAGLIVSTLVLKAFDFPPGLFEKYSISTTSIVLAGMVGVLQIYALLEFYLLANDQEQSVLTCSVIGSCSFFALFGLAGALQLSLEWFVAAVFMARLIHVATLAAAIRVGRRP